MLQIRGKLGKFCRKSGATWGNFVANQGQVDFFARVILRCARALARERNGCLC